MDINFAKQSNGQFKVPARVTEFLSSFGMMLVGVALLFAGSVTVTAKPVHTLVSELPRSDKRVVTLGGGDVVYQVLPVSRPTVPLQKDNSVYTGAFTAAAVVVIDDESNTVLFKKNSTDIRPLASITKLMSALVLERMSMNWASTTLVTDEDYDSNSHVISVGEKFTLEDLWHAALVGSSNSAILTLVRNSGLTQEQFVKRMNSTAQELGLSTLRFTEPTGLSGDNLGSAQDIARLLKEALKVPHIADALHSSEYYLRPLGDNAKARRVWSTNWLLTRWVPSSFDNDHIVGKTGFINDSGYNFSVRLTGKNNHSIRVVVLGASANEARFTEARDIADWIFAHVVWPDEEGYQALVE